MIKKILTTVAAMIAVTTLTHAADAKVRLMYTDGSNDDVLMLTYRNGYITYKLNPQDLNITRVAPSRVESIYFYKPLIFDEAMSLYQGRKFEEARAKFAECEQLFKAIDTAPNNYATLAGFYKLECSRRLFDFATLAKDLEGFRKDGLTRENHLQQLEVYAFWEAVRLKDWSRLDRLAQSWRAKKVTGSQRAQISYCHGLALENLAKEDPKLVSKALNAYNMALTADFAASNEIVLAAAQNALRIYATDPEVKLAMKLWGTEDEAEGSGGHQRLLEANTLVKFYNQAGLGAVAPLSAEYRNFLKYEAKDENAMPADAGEDKEEAKEEDADEKEAETPAQPEEDGDEGEKEE